MSAKNLPKEPTSYTTTATNPDLPREDLCGCESDCCYKRLSEREWRKMVSGGFADLIERVEALEKSKGVFTQTSKH